MGEGGDIRGKVSMKTLFGKANIKKDGTEGKVRRRACADACGMGPGHGVVTSMQWCCRRGQRG